MSDWSHLTDDPEIAALLDFEPVVRKCKRHDGWTADRQRGYIVGLAETGKTGQAAFRVGRTASGAWKVRASGGAQGFSDAWDLALDLHHGRNPPLPPPEPKEPSPPRLGGPASPLRGRAMPRAVAAPEPPEISDAEAERLLDEILKRYLLKLRQERQCRLAGRIVEADFYVRQLTFLEIVIDIGGKAQALLETLKAGDTELLQVAATPGSALLEKARRALWLEQGEADRPPPARLGAHDGERATGEPTDYNSARDGDFTEWERRRAEARALAAEAQAEWERRARAEAGPSTRSGQSEASDEPSAEGEGGEA